MVAFLSIISPITFVDKVMPIKSTVLPEVSKNGAGKTFLVEIENKMFLQTIRIL